MLRVFKYTVLACPATFAIDLPEGAQIISARVQDNMPRIWVLVDPEKPDETRRFITVGTGGMLVLPASKLNFIGTFLLDGECYVLHLFEEVEEIELL